jgi:hypothetical protein
VVAVNLLELAVSPGLDTIEAAGGIGAFTGWRREVAAVILAERTSEPALAGERQGSGWRARRLPLITADSGGELTVRSALDGSTHHFDEAALIELGAALGAPAPALATPAGGRLHWWRSQDQPPTTPGWIVSSVPADAAGAGFFWAGGEWRNMTSLVEAGAPGPLAEGCACRACAIAGSGYIAHLWRQREITAAHLLGWHNLCQARSLVEGG